MTRILVIEDEDSLHPLYRVLLDRLKYDVAVARTGAEGIAAAVKSPPDVVVLDLMLPDKPGLEVARELQALGLLNGTPLIITTGLGQQDAKAIGQSLMATSVLVKPFGMNEMIGAIRNAANSIAARSSNAARSI